MKDYVREAPVTKFRNAGIPRQKYLKTFEKWLGRPEIIILKGVRRSGKSTIITQMASKLKKAVYVNFDDYRFLEHLKLSLLDDIIKEFPDMDYYFFDEVQKVPGFESWLRTHYDIKSHRKFIISGSNISMLTPELGSVLTGRNVTFEVFPLDYEEFRKFSRGSFEKYLLFGGFPEVVLEKDEEKKKKLLLQYFDDILLKDILEKRKLLSTSQFRAVTNYIISNSGLKISSNKLAKELGINSRTAESYLSHLTDAYLTFEVPFFSYSAKTKYAAQRSSKYYSIDNGLTTALAAKANRGHLFESVVAQTLRRKGQEIYHWIGKKEVDFIQNHTAYQVTTADAGKESFAELLKEFRHVKETKTITPGNLDEI